MFNWLSLVVISFVLANSVSPTGAIANVWDVPLSTQSPSVERGERIVKDADKASCLLCHSIAQVNDPFQGNIGPDLSDIGIRSNASSLRFRLMFPQQINPQSPMPSYFATDHNLQTEAQYQNKSVYTAQEVEDVIAFLLTLKGVSTP